MFTIDRTNRSVFMLGYDNKATSITWQAVWHLSWTNCPVAKFRDIGCQMSRYRRTSSVGAMLEELNWEPLAPRHHTARLVLFHKIHYGLVAINMPLELKHNSGPTRTENYLAYHIPASSVDYQKNSFFYRTVRDWNCVLLTTKFRDYVSP